MDEDYINDQDPTEIETVRHHSGEYGSTETLYRGSDPADLEEPPIAPLSERFAAFFIDCMFLGYLLAFIYPFIVQRLHQTTINPLHWERIHQLSLAGIVGAGFFFYFFLFEGIFARTPGKLLCRLSVTGHTGGPPSIFSILIRNLLRFVDLAFFPIAGFGFAEASSKRQRLGDFLAGTSVRRFSHRGQAIMPYEELRWGTVTRRSIALLLDLVFFALATLFFLLALPTDRLQITKLILNSGPVLIIAYWVGFETLLGGTPAKLLLGLRVVDEVARPVRLPASFIRNLFRLLDHNPLGYLCAVLASRKQRPGDLAACTSVVRVPWSARRLLSLIVAGGLIIGIGHYGVHNPKSFIRTDYRIKVGSWILPDIHSSAKYYLGYRLHIKEFYFGRPEVPAGDQPLYSPGELVHYTIDVSGFIKTNGQAWLQQDLLVAGPNGETIIDLLNVTNKRFHVGKSSSQLLTGSFLVPPAVQPGLYTVQVRVRDAQGEMQGQAKSVFVVR